MRSLLAKIISDPQEMTEGNVERLLLVCNAMRWSPETEKFAQRAIDLIETFTRSQYPVGVPRRQITKKEN